MVFLGESDYYRIRVGALLPGLNSRACCGTADDSGALPRPSAKKVVTGGAGFARASSLPLRCAHLATGCPALDSLTGGLCEGLVHLFSGPPEFLDELLHSVLVEGCSRGNVAYLNNTDYYRIRSEISPDRIAQIAKKRGLDYRAALERILFAAAYSGARQPQAACALEGAARERGDIALVAVHDISAFRGERGEGSSEMDLVASCMWRLASETGAAVVLTSRDRKLCSRLVLDLSQVIVDFKVVGEGVRATLSRHPERATPASVLIPFAGNCYGADLMGRITPPFRQSYQELLGSLRGGYLALIREPGNRAGFESLIRDAWDREYAAMAASGIPAILDVMNLTANAHNRGAIEALKRELAEKEARIRALEAKIASLEDRLPDH